MKFNKEKLNEIAKMDDAELWSTVKGIASRYGIKLPDGVPPRTEMSRLRAAMTGTEKINLAGAMEILNKYRRGKS